MCVIASSTVQAQSRFAKLSNIFNSTSTHFAKPQTHLKIALVRHDLVILCGVPSAKDRREGDDRGREPRQEQHDRHHPLGHVDRVLEWFDDRVVSVHTDAAEVQDRRGGEVHVQRVPHVAHELREHPPGATRKQRRFSRFFVNLKLQ